MDSDAPFSIMPKDLLVIGDTLIFCNNSSNCVSIYTISNGKSCFNIEPSSLPFDSLYKLAFEFGFANSDFDYTNSSFLKNRRIEKIGIQHNHGVISILVSFPTVINVAPITNSLNKEIRTKKHYGLVEYDISRGKTLSVCYVNNDSLPISTFSSFIYYNNKLILPLIDSIKYNSNVNIALVLKRNDIVFETDSLIQEKKNDLLFKLKRNNLQFSAIWPLSKNEFYLNNNVYFIENNEINLKSEINSNTVNSHFHINKQDTYFIEGDLKGLYNLEDTLAIFKKNDTILFKSHLKYISGIAYDSDFYYFLKFDENENVYILKKKIN